MDDDMNPVDTEYQTQRQFQEMLFDTQKNIADYLEANGIVLEAPANASREDKIAAAKNYLRLIQHSGTIVKFRYVLSQLQDKEEIREYTDAVATLARIHLVIDGNVVGPWADYIEKALPGSWPNDEQITLYRVGLNERVKNQIQDEQLNSEIAELIRVLVDYGYDNADQDYAALFGILAVPEKSLDKYQRRALALDAIHNFAIEPLHPAWRVVLDMKYPI